MSICCCTVHAGDSGQQFSESIFLSVDRQREDITNKVSRALATSKAIIIAIMALLHYAAIMDEPFTATPHTILLTHHARLQDLAELKHKNNKYYLYTMNYDGFK